MDESNPFEMLIGGSLFANPFIFQNQRDRSRALDAAIAERQADTQYKMALTEERRAMLEDVLRQAKANATATEADAAYSQMRTKAMGMELETMPQQMALKNEMDQMGLEESRLQHGQFMEQFPEKKELDHVTLQRGIREEKTQMGMLEDFMGHMDEARKITAAERADQLETQVAMDKNFEDYMATLEAKMGVSIPNSVVQKFKKKFPGAMSKAPQGTSEEEVMAQIGQAALSETLQIQEQQAGQMIDFTGGIGSMFPGLMGGMPGWMNKADAAEFQQARGLGSMPDISQGGGTPAGFLKGSQPQPQMGAGFKGSLGPTEGQTSRRLPGKYQ